MRTVLVTGGAGFIGSHFVKRLLRSEDVATVTVLDALTYAGHIENLGEAFLDPKLDFVEGNILVGRLALYLGDRDVPDPFGQPGRAFNDCIEMIIAGAAQHLQRPDD